MPDNPAASMMTDINWNTWQPDDIATLLFVIQSEKILLIRKKRGMGQGKINGPGGKLEANETIRECAVRETEEELKITAVNPQWCGENLFQFTSGYAMHVHIFTAAAYTGTPTETDEALPLWYPISKMPFEQMWEDDYLWIPRMLAGTLFRGCYVFNDDTMLDYAICEALTPYYDIP